MSWNDYTDKDGNPIEAGKGPMTSIDAQIVDRIRNLEDDDCGDLECTRQGAITFLRGAGLRIAALTVERDRLRALHDSACEEAAEHLARAERLTEALTELLRLRYSAWDDTAGDKYAAAWQVARALIEDVYADSDNYAYKIEREK